MRDHFDHYFAGWNLIPGLLPEEKEQFARLVKAMGDKITQDPVLAEDWRVHPFDDKSSVFGVFFKKFLDSGSITPELSEIAGKVRSKLKL